MELPGSSGEIHWIPSPLDSWHHFNFPAFARWFLCNAEGVERRCAHQLVCHTLHSSVKSGSTFRQFYGKFIPAPPFGFGTCSLVAWTLLLKLDRDGHPWSRSSDPLVFYCFPAVFTVHLSRTSSSPHVTTSPVLIQLRLTYR